MHPDMLRELINQRGREMRSGARQANLAVSLRRELRAQRHGELDEPALIPRIPDYADGTFHDGTARVPQQGRPVSPAGRSAG